MKKRSEIRIRDPFILTDKENGRTYKLYSVPDTLYGYFIEIIHIISSLDLTLIMIAKFYTFVNNF